MHLNSVVQWILPPPVIRPRNPHPKAGDGLRYTIKGYISKATAGTRTAILSRLQFWTVFMPLPPPPQRRVTWSSSARPDSTTDRHQGDARGVEHRSSASRKARAHSESVAHHSTAGFGSGRYPR